MQEYSQNQRIVRVFVSSTFQDMHAEREALAKYTFPELHKRCRERRVEFMDVDLRWGVTDEQKAEGKVLPICLAEIERCRPYFIGLLGERYGWVPAEIHPELLEDHQWLNNHKEKSITDLEIQHGVLENPNIKGVSFFYFRNPSYINTLSPEKRKNFTAENAERAAKLKKLKESILQTNYPVRKDFRDAKTVGQWILEDLWAVIDKRFPKKETPTQLEQHRFDHEAFASARRKIYIGRDEYFEALNEHVVRDTSPLVLLGESGSGKSALIANWAEKYQEDHTDDFMVFHYIGSTSESADYIHMLRRIMEEIKERYEPKEKVKDSESRSALSISGEQKEDDIPTDPKKVVEAFPLWLAKVAARGKFILVLDALNQLEDRDNALDLGWLPTYFPPNVRVILSTLPGRSFEAIKKQEWKIITVKPIEREEQIKLINDYLNQFRKKLDLAHQEHISKANQTANPLFLKTLLDELRLFGIHEKLEERINHYLTAKGVDDLFKLVLDRLEEDYEQESEHKGLVKNVMTHIWASRKGLSETEILELINLPSAAWSPLYLALEESFIKRSGLLNFFHDFLRKAVENRYLHTKEQKQEAHLSIADYFDKKDINHRKIDELPWQLSQVKAWQRLYALLADLPFFHDAYKVNEFEIGTYWAQVETNSQLKMTDVYQPVLHFPEHNIEYISSVVQRMHRFGYSKLILKPIEYLIHHCEKAGDLENLSFNLLLQANSFYGMEEFDKAMNIFKKIEKISRELEDNFRLSSAIGGQANVFYAIGNHKYAIKFYKKQEHFCRLTGCMNGLQNSLA